MSAWCSIADNEQSFPSEPAKAFEFYINYMFLKDSQEDNYCFSPKAATKSIDTIAKTHAPTDRLLLEVGTNTELPSFLSAVEQHIPRLLNDLGFEHTCSKHAEAKGVVTIIVRCFALDVHRFFRTKSARNLYLNPHSSNDTVMSLPADHLSTSLRRAIRAALPSRIEEGFNQIGLTGVMVKSPEWSIQSQWVDAWSKNAHAAVVPWLFTSTHRVLHAIANQSDYLANCRAKGLLRPWLLLVSMHPGRRRALAEALDIPVTDSYGFQPAAEAHGILLGPLGICNQSIWKAAKADVSGKSDGINPWVKILIREAGTWSGIEVPDDVLRLDRSANFSLARERSNRADDLSEPGRMERMLLHHHQSRMPVKMRESEFTRLPGTMEGLESLCEREERLEEELEENAIRDCGIAYESGTGWTNRQGKGLFWIFFSRIFGRLASSCASTKTTGLTEVESHGVVLAILNQRLILAYENADFSSLVKEGAKEIS